MSIQIHSVVSNSIFETTQKTFSKVNSTVKRSVQVVVDRVLNPKLEMDATNSFMFSTFAVAYVNYGLLCYLLLLTMWITYVTVKNYLKSNPDNTTVIISEKPKKFRKMNFILLKRQFFPRKAYENFIRRVPQDNLYSINHQLMKVSYRQQIDFVSALNDQRWDDPIFKDANYPYYALKAFDEQRITSHQLATVMFYWINFSKSSTPVSMIPLFLKGGAINPRARELIKETLLLRNLEIPEEGVKVEVPPGASFLNEYEIDAFFERMKTLPASEQCFFMKEKSSIPPIIKAIQENGINVFHETSQGIMIPSMGMM